MGGALPATTQGSETLLAAIACRHGFRYSGSDDRRLPFPHLWNYKEPLKIFETFYWDAEKERDRESTTAISMWQECRPYC